MSTRQLILSQAILFGFTAFNLYVLRDVHVKIARVDGSTDKRLRELENRMESGHSSTTFPDGEPVQLAGNWFLRNSRTVLGSGITLPEDFYKTMSDEQQKALRKLVTKQEEPK